MVGGVLGGHQMQDRGQYYGDAGDDGAASSQPMAMGLPMKYAQVRRLPQHACCISLWTDGRPDVGETAAAASMLQSVVQVLQASVLFPTGVDLLRHMVYCSGVIHHLDIDQTECLALVGHDWDGVDWHLLTLVQTR